MQYLNLNGRSVFCLFDRGANQHLVEGQLAEELSFKVYRKEPCEIGVVSGSTVVTEYGSYQLLLGPTASGKYHELVTQGITSITSKIAKYDLSVVNSEAREYTDLPSNTVLPTYVGDCKIGLLIGLKSPELEPTCIFTLPSGIGLYKSPFKDIFGSYYCYGGPHESFSYVNKQCHGSAKHFNIYLTQAVNQYRNSLYPSLLDTLKLEPIESEYSVSNDAEPNLTYTNMSSTPITLNDGTELGQSFIDKKDDYCKEESVTNNLEEKCGFVDLPFVKPVDNILPKRHKGSDNLHKDIQIYEYHCNYSDGKEVKICVSLYDLVNIGVLLLVLWLILLGLNWKSTKMEEDSLFPFLLCFQILIFKARLVERCPCDVSTIFSHSDSLKCGRLAGLLKSSKKEEESLFPFLLWVQFLIKLSLDLWNIVFMISASVSFYSDK